MNTYNIEVTDTYAGEANYCWVNRYTVKAKSIRGAVNKLAREIGSGWRFAYGDSLFSRYNLKGACICMFVEFDDNE